MSKEFNERELSAALLTDEIAEINSAVRKGIVTGDLVRAVVAADVFSRPLERHIESDDATDLARAWRFLVFAEKDKRQGVGIVQFAINTEDIDGLNNHQASPLHIAAFNNAIMLNESPMVRHLFSAVGGDVTDKVSETEALFFAGLERRYRKVETPEGDTYTNWVQLVYPEALSETTNIMQETIKLLKQNRRSPKNWMDRAANEHNRRQTADAMALSALNAFEVTAI